MADDSRSNLTHSAVRRCNMAPRTFCSTRAKFPVSHRGKLAPLDTPPLNPSFLTCSGAPAGGGHGSGLRYEHHEFGWCPVSRINLLHQMGVRAVILRRIRSGPFRIWNRRAAGRTCRAIGPRANRVWSWSAGRPVGQKHDAGLRDGMDESKLRPAYRDHRRPGGVYLYEQAGDLHPARDRYRYTQFCRGSAAFPAAETPM